MTTGWHYTQKPEYRRRLIYESTDKRQSKYKRYLSAARKMTAVANVSQNKNAKQTALSDANYFYRKVRQMKKNKRPKVVESKKIEDKRFDRWSDDYMRIWGGK